MAGFTLTKTGTNQVALVGTAVNNPGSILVNQGIFSLHLATYLGGSSANTITLQSGSALNFYQSPLPQEWTLVINNGKTYWSSVGVAGQNDWNGPVSVHGDVTILAESPCQFFGNVTGSGSIIKTGAATTSLSGSNSYAGNTTVSGTTRAFTDDSGRQFNHHGREQCRAAVGLPDHEYRRNPPGQWRSQITGSYSSSQSRLPRWPGQPARDVERPADAWLHEIRQCAAVLVVRQL